MNDVSVCKSASPDLELLSTMQFAFEQHSPRPKELWIELNAGIALAHADADPLHRPFAVCDESDESGGES